MWENSERDMNDAETGEKTGQMEEKKLKSMEKKKQKRIIGGK